MKAVIFDLDDTLYDCNYINNLASVDAVCRFAAEKLLFLPVEEVRTAFDRARVSIKEEMEGDPASQHNRMLYFQRTLELLGIPPVSYALEMYDYFWKDFLNRIRLFPNAKDVLDYLEKKNIKIAICTDMTVHIQHRKLRTLGIADQIAVLVTSEEVGVEKPAGRIYEKVLEKLSLPASECCYVGDSLKKDVLGPMALGMQAVWYRDKEFCNLESDRRTIEKQCPNSRVLRMDSHRELLSYFQKEVENDI